MFPRFAAKDSLRVWQIHFCNGRFEECARLKLARAGEGVPKDLLPNGKRFDVGAVRR
jgi:hypothetical protein